MTSSHVPAPTLSHALRKELRVLLNFATYLVQKKTLRDLPHGQGNPVLVLPGYLASDRSTWILRRFLARIGYRTFGWELGKNRGNVEELLKILKGRLEKLHHQHGEKIRLVGWSLGGVLARELAREHPELVHSVVSLGSPIIGGARYTVLERRYRERPGGLDEIDRQVASRAEIPINVPLLSIYSKNDGIVAWQASLDWDARHQVEHAEVTCSHLGFGFDVETFRLLADFLQK